MANVDPVPGSAASALGQKRALAPSALNSCRPDKPEWLWALQGAENETAVKPGPLVLVDFVKSRCQKVDQPSDRGQQSSP